MKCNCQEFEKNYRNCTVCSKSSKFVVQENKRKYILSNPHHKRVCKVRIDNCVIENPDQKKCDYLLIICNQKSEAEDLYFIELKGKKFMVAVEQLTQTLEYLKENNFKITGRVYARAVLTKVPEPKTIEIDAKVIRLKKLLKKYKGDFCYGSVQYSLDHI